MGRGKKIIDTGLVVRKALELIEAEGYAAFSTRKLAAELGVSAMTLYNYFENREAIVRDCLLYAFERFGEELMPSLEEAAVSGDNPLRAYLRLASLLLDFGQRHPRLYLFLFDTDLAGLRRDPRIGARYRQLLEVLKPRLGDPAAFPSLADDSYCYSVLLNALVLSVLSGRSGMTGERCLLLASRAYAALLGPHEAEFRASP